MKIGEKEYIVKTMIFDPKRIINKKVKDNNYFIIKHNDKKIGIVHIFPSFSKVKIKPYYIMRAHVFFILEKEYSEILKISNVLEEITNESNFEFCSYDIDKKNNGIDIEENLYLLLKEAETTSDIFNDIYIDVWDIPLAAETFYRYGGPKSFIMRIANALSKKISLTDFFREDDNSFTIKIEHIDLLNSTIDADYITRYYIVRMNNNLEIFSGDENNPFLIERRIKEFIETHLGYYIHVG